MRDFPIEYCCSYRLGSGETTEDFYCCADIEAAYEKAKDDIKNKPLCEEIFFADHIQTIRYRLDNFESESGRLEIGDKRSGIACSRHVGSFADTLPLGQIDHSNRRVFDECGRELFAFFDGHKSIKDTFLVLEDNDYCNIFDHITETLKLGDAVSGIVRKHYGDFERVISERYAEHMALWCRDYFGGFFRYEFRPDYVPPRGTIECDVPF